MATNTEKIVVQVVVKGGKDLDRLGKKTGNATKAAGGLTKGMAKMAAGIAAAAAAFRMVSGAISAAIKTFTAFEFQMAKVKAITGASTSEFLKLEKTAQDLGRSTFFTATQVATLQMNYAKLGFTTKEILLAQEATLNLATATGTDLARAAMVAGASVRGFGLDASETGRVTDVMTMAFASSALDIEKWQTSMTKVAPIAAGMNIPLEETAAIMGTLTDAGIEASIAGTSMRNIFLQMKNPASKLSQFLGFTVRSSDDLSRAMTKLSSVNGDTLDGLVQTRQVASFNVMVKGAERVQNLTEKLKEANGSAKAMAGIVGDTLEGAFKRLTSAWEGLQIAFVDKFGEQLKNITDGIANFVNGLTDIIDVPLSQSLEADRLAVNNLFNAIADQNSSQDTRQRLMKKLNTQYAEYLPNLITEKTSLKNLRIAQSNVNKALMQKVTILAAEELLAANVKKQLDNEIEAAELSVEKFDLLRNQKEAQINTNKRLQNSLSGVDVNMSNANVKVSENTEKIRQNKIESIELKNEYDKVADAARSLGVDVDGLVDSLNLETEATATNTTVLAKNTEEKKKAKEVEVNVNQERINNRISNTEIEVGLQRRLLNGKITQQEFDQQFVATQIENMQSVLDHDILTTEERSKLTKSLNDLKLNGLNEEAVARQKNIDGVAQLGASLVNMAGEDKKMQGIRKAGIAISTAASIANNIQTLSEVSLGVAAQAKLPFPANIIGMASTLAAVVSLFANMATLGDTFGDGGVVDTFANGGMVNGKSHAQGGEKFAVGGRVVELEGGEAVINKRSTSMFRNQLSAMNSAGGGVKFADGGLLNQPSFSQQEFSALNNNQMMGAMGGSGKVVVVEADITESQNTVSVIQSQATI